MLKLEENFTNDMTDIKDEIFETNSTLFQVLDKNEVTDIVSIRQEQERQNQLIQENKQQLDGLARVVDTNQANNASEFVRINTQFVEIEQSLDAKFAEIDLTTESLKQDSAELIREVKYLDSYTQSIDQRVSEFEFNFDNINNNIEQLKQETVENKEATEALRDNVRVDLASFDRRIKTLENKSQDLETRIVKLERYSNGILRFNITYSFRMKESSESMPRTWRITLTSGSLSFGGTVNGTTSTGGTVRFSATSIKGQTSDVLDFPIPLNTWLHASGNVSTNTLRFVIQESYGIYLSP